MKTLKERLNEMTLKELINETKRLDSGYGYNTKILVYMTSVGKDNERHSVVINPDSDKFMDRMAMVAFEDCTVSDTTCRQISDKDYLHIIIVDLDKHYDKVCYDK